MSAFALELFCIYFAIAYWYATEKGWFALEADVADVEENGTQTPALFEIEVDPAVATTYGRAALDSDSDYGESELGSATDLEASTPLPLPVEDKVVTSKRQRKSLAATGRGFQKK